MTLRIETSGLADKILALFGKRRALILPRAGKPPYGNYLIRRESFWGALLRPAGRPLPSGRVYPGELDDSVDHE